MTGQADLAGREIALLIPCYNEALTIAKVIHDFRQFLPEARIYVFDNNSSDGSRELALQAGAQVIKEKRQGKGYVINAMFQKITADLYVMVDGDDTYPAEAVYALLAPILEEEADMVVGQRLSSYTQAAFRPLHLTGNRVICALINLIFSSNLKDPMSGYRAFTREVALDLPVVAGGFDIETEMTLQLLYRKFVIREVSVAYKERPHGSVSKLRTFQDGFRVLLKIFSIIRAYKPLTFFGGMGLVGVLSGVITAAISIQRYLEHDRVDLPLLSESIILFLSGAMSGTVGIILHTLNFRLLELSNLISKRINPR